ncbi:MAG: ABC transporter ATP-binding protein [Acidimicrobiia bacterium]
MTMPTAAGSPVSGVTTPRLRVADITLRFGGLTALHDVHFEVFPGELFAIIGPNGAGKTSIFNCINGVYRPNVGSITLDGQSLLDCKPWQTAQRGVARTFQNLALFSHLSVIDNVMLGRHLQMRGGFVGCGTGMWGLMDRWTYGWRVRRRPRSSHSAFRRMNDAHSEVLHRRRCAEVLDLLALGPYRALPVGILPYGVQKRVDLARALVMEPRLLLLDEPVAGMNNEETEAMAKAVLEVQAEMHLSTVLVEHDMHLVMAVADRVMALDFGVPIMTGTPEAVRQDPMVIAAYLGASNALAQEER